MPKRRRKERNTMPKQRHKEGNATPKTGVFDRSQRHPMVSQLTKPINLVKAPYAEGFIPDFPLPFFLLKMWQFLNDSTCVALNQLL